MQQRRFHYPLSMLWCLVLAFTASACGDLPPAEETLRAEQAIDARLLAAMRAGLDEARMRQIAVPEASALPTAARTADGAIHPLVQRWAFDGDGNLRGDGPSMAVLQADLEQQRQYDRERSFMCRFGPNFCSR